MALTGRLHLAAVVPVKVIEEGGVLVQLLAGADGAAGVVLPGPALGGEDTGHNLLPPPASPHLVLVLLSQVGCPRPSHCERPSLLGFQEVPSWGTLSYKV